MIRGTINFIDPTSISGLTAWYKADAITGLKDADLVTAWADSSGTGNGLITGTAAPIYKTNQANGLPIVRFTRSSTQNLLNNAPVSMGSFDMNFFVVAKRNTVGAVNHTFIHIGGSSGGRQFRLASDKLDFTKTNTLDIATAYNPITSTTAYQLMECYFDNSVNNGLQFTTNGNPSGTFSKSATFSDTSAKIWIGRNGVNSTEYLDGDVAEIVIYNHGLNVLERANMYQYLAVKYNLSGITVARTDIL